MRKFFGILSIALFLFSFSPAFVQAAEIEVGGDGALRAVEQAGQTWTPTGVSVSDEALAFGDAWKEAFRNPGRAVTVKTHKEHEMTGPFTETIKTFADTGILYDKVASTVTVGSVVAVEETSTRLNLFLIFAIIALLAVAASRVLLKKNKAGAFVIAFCAAVVAAYFASMAAADVSVVAFMVAIIAFIPGCIALLAGSDMLHKMVSYIFYIAMPVAIYMMYT